jgi:hypothetical protein
VTNLVLTKLKEAAWGPPDRYSVHARYNCMLLIGDLNEQEPTVSGSGTVKPFGPALSVLLEAVTQADVPAAMKVAALIGIQRHARLGIADKNMERQVIVELSKLVPQKSPPTETSVDGHNWMRRQAIDVLLSLKQPGPANEVVNALTAAVTDEENPMAVRLDAIRALGQFKLPPKAMGEELTPLIGELTLDVLQKETNRRALRVAFQSLLIGMKGQDNQGGMLATTSGPDRKLADELAQKIGIWGALVSNPLLDPMGVTTQMAIEATEFEIWLLGEDPNAVPVTNPVSDN